MYLYDKNRITYFAETDRRNKRIPFGIKADDRTRHMYIIGKTGMGKSTCIENMAVQDIKNGEGLAFIDPHGKSAALLLDYIPPERVKDVIYFAPFDTDHPISFNVMEDVGPDKRHLVANGLLSAFKKIWGPETFSARMEYILMNALLALLEYPDSTLLGVSRMLTDKVYRKKVVDNVKDPSVKAYWVDEFAKYSENYAKEAVPGIQNKLGQFTSNPLIRNIIGQPHSSFDLRMVMDERKILIVNLSKGQLGEGNANLLGGMIITKIYLAAMSRADLTEGELKKLPNFYMYVDEFQSFANESFADILSEARKYKLSLIMAHQYIEQMDEKVRAAVFGNVGTQIMFRVGATDAELLEKEYAPVFTAEDMVNLGFTQIYLKLMIDGVASHPFSAVTMPPIAPMKKSLREEVIKSSQELFGRPREDVEKAIAEWYGPIVESEPAQKHDASKPPAFARREYPPSEEGAAQKREERPPVVRSESNAFFERPNRNLPEKRTEQNFGGRARPAAPAEGKLEKPFAKVLRDIVPPVRTSEPSRVPEKIPLASLAANAHHEKSAPTKSKGPSTHNLSSLKSALAEVLHGHEEKKEPEKSAPASDAPKTAPSPLPSAPKEPREVPEDVLTAILHGGE